MKTLIIDTSSNKEVIVGLDIDGDKMFDKRLLDHRKAQVVLPMIDEILKKNKLDLKDLTGIEVNTGPGSFTGLRVGVSIANAFGFVLKIPINGESVSKTVEPRYK